MMMDRIEVITSVERRRRWRAAEKARLVAAMDEPGAVVTEIARRAEVNASLLYRWRRDLRGARRTPTFVPVRVAREASDEGPASAPACTPPSPSLPPPPPARSSITIAFGVEVRMTIEGAPDASTLANVIGVLTAPDRIR
jgi:transposase